MHQIRVSDRPLCLSVSLSPLLNVLSLVFCPSVRPTPPFPAMHSGTSVRVKQRGVLGVWGGTLLEDGSWTGKRDVQQTTDGQNVEGVEL